MACSKPFRQGVMEYGCGRCLGCRISRRRLWTHRLLLEQHLHEASSFITLTYADEAQQQGSVERSEVQGFLKRLRRRVEPMRLRYFFVGEYGEESAHAHYHAALFGFPQCRYGRTQHALQERGTCCDVCGLLRDCWGAGAIDSATLEEQSAQYIAGYVTKKLTSVEAMEWQSQRDARYAGRKPEFSLMSRHPGIGAGAMEAVATSLRSVPSVEAAIVSSDVPSALRSFGKEKSLGRYLRQRLRQEFGIEKPQDVQEKEVEKLRALCEAEGVATVMEKRKVEREVRVLQAETKARIWRKKGSI